MKTIVAFDFDGTLTKKDSFLEFIKFSKGRMKFYINLPVMAFLWVAFKLNLIKRDKAKEMVFGIFFKGMPLSKFDSYCNLFSQRIDDFLRKQSIETIKNYSGNDSKVIIISASIENWIQPWALKNGIKTVLGTKVAVDSKGLLTGEFSSKNCRRIEKVNRLLIQFPNRNEYKLIAFGNSLGDKELIKFADEGLWNSIK